MKKFQREWQAKFTNWVGGSRFGVLCAGVRRRGRGPWIRPIDAPEVVREFLALKQTPGAGRWYCQEFQNLDTMQKEAMNSKTTLTGDGLLVRFVVEEARDERPVPCHSLIRRLAKDYFCDSLRGIYRGAYKYSACGVSVGFLIADGKGGAKWSYCSSLPDTPIDELMRTAEVVAACVTGYVEGTDVDCQPIILQSTRDKRLTPDDWYSAIESADAEAKEIWNDTHGCDDCGDENEYGSRAINPKCKTCKGQGVIC